jgi:hypothetical protein
MQEPAMQEPAMQEPAMQDPMSITAPTDVVPPEPATPPIDMAALMASQQKAKTAKFHAPIPGQSLTSSPGSHPYEQPPQFTALEDVTGYMFDKLTSPKVYRDLMRLLDAGVPFTYILEPMILQGVNNGVFNLDLGIMALKPVSVIVAGLAARAGIDVTWNPPDQDPGVNPEPIRKIFASKKKVETPMPAQEQRTRVSNSLLGKQANG